MKDIPSMQEPEALRAAYKAAYGESDDAYQHDHLDWLEFRLLSDAYYGKFGSHVGTMCVYSISDLSAKIRESLAAGKPYKPNVPEGALI